MLNVVIIFICSIIYQMPVLKGALATSDSRQVHPTRQFVQQRVSFTVNPYFVQPGRSSSILFVKPNGGQNPQLDIHSFVGHPASLLDLRSAASFSRAIARIRKSSGLLK